MSSETHRTRRRHEHRKPGIAVQALRRWRRGAAGTPATIAVDAVLRPGERRHPGALGEARRAGIGVHHQEVDGVGEPAWHHPVAEPPAGHRVRLREAVENDGLVEHAVELRDRLRLLLVADARIDLVAQDQHVAIAQQIGDARQVLLERSRRQSDWPAN